jgi:hypothetical protein
MLIGEAHGEVPERLNGRDWKSRNGGNLVRGFESPPLRFCRVCGGCSNHAFGRKGRCVTSGPIYLSQAAVHALKGVSPYDRVRFAEYVLEEEGGGPLHVRVIAERMYRLGYKHRSQPKNPEQILSSLNSLASPSQHPERFKRSGSRSLELVR